MHFKDFVKEAIDDKLSPKKCPYGNKVPQHRRRKAKLRKLKAMAKSKKLKEATERSVAVTQIGPSNYYNASDGLPPFARHSTSSNNAGIDMRDISKMDSDFMKSTSHKRPYPLDVVMDYIAKSGQYLQDVDELVKTTLDYNKISLKRAELDYLKKAKQCVKTSLGNINKAAKYINTIKV